MENGAPQQDAVCVSVSRSLLISAQLDFFRTRLAFFLVQVAPSFVVFSAITVPITPENLAASHVIVTIAAAMRVSVLAGLLRLIHGTISRVEDMSGRCGGNVNRT